MSTSEYIPAFSDSIAAGDKTRDFVANFYELSDDPSRNDEWVACFLPNAVLVMGDMTAKGTDEIANLRQKMWEKVSTRKHRPQKVFASSFGDARGKMEYMLFGGLVYEMKTGEKQEVSWAAHAVLEKDEERGLKFRYYRVYIQR